MKRAYTAFIVLGVMVAAFVVASPAYATFPGHNGRIAFQADTGAGNQIYTVRPNGHGLFQVTHVKPQRIDPGKRRHDAGLVTGWTLDRLFAE